MFVIALFLENTVLGQPYQITTQPFVTLNVAGGQNPAAELR